jgi:hypothetical protein
VTDWKAIARARGMDIPANELERTLHPLDSLEETFRPMVRHLGPADEPATVFRPGENEE